MPGEHQLELDIVRMADRLQGLLDAVTPGVGLLAGRGRLVLRPVREQAGAEAAHAVDLVGADFEGLFRRDKDQRGIRGPERLGKAVGDPALRRDAIVHRQVDEPAARADMERRNMLADRLDGVGDLPLGALLQFFQEVIEDRGGVEPGRAVPVEQDVPSMQGQQPLLPGIGDRALLGQERSRAKLEGDRPEFRVVDPIGPFVQIPNAARHKDRRRVEAELAH